MSTAADYTYRSADRTLTRTARWLGRPATSPVALTRCGRLWRASCTIASCAANDHELSGKPHPSQTAAAEAGNRHLAVWR